MAHIRDKTGRRQGDAFRGGFEAPIQDGRDGFWCRRLNALKQQPFQEEPPGQIRVAKLQRRFDGNLLPIGGVEKLIRRGFVQAEIKSIIKKTLQGCKPCGRWLGRFRAVVVKAGVRSTMK
jgi:hypothetical protein